MAEAPIDLDLAEELRASPSVVSQSGPLLPPRQKTRATKLWKHFERTPPLGQTGPGSSNPFALCTLCPSGTAVTSFTSQGQFWSDDTSLEVQRNII